jgi:hypothetical protein
MSQSCKMVVHNGFKKSLYQTIQEGSKYTLNSTSGDLDKTPIYANKNHFSTQLLTFILLCTFLLSKS